MIKDDLHDWTVRELLAPIEITDGLFTVLEGVEPPADPEAVVVHLVRSKSFGTGAHPATRAVVFQMMIELGIMMPASRSPKRLLDLDAGSGLLGILAKLFYPALDSVSVASADDFPALLDNHVGNGEPLDLLLSAPAFEGEELRRRFRGRCDLVVSQAGASARLDLMAEALAPTGVLIIGGHAAREHYELRRDLSEWAEIESVADVDGWPVFAARKIIEA